MLMITSCSCSEWGRWGVPDVVPGVCAGRGCRNGTGLTTPGTPGSIIDVSTALLHSPDGGRMLAKSLGDRFPGYTYLAPSPENVIRLAGRSERFCAYQGNLGTIPMHFHTMAEITLIRKVSGTGSLRVAGRHYPAASGLLAFVPSNVLHGQTGDTPLIKDVCMFDMGLVAPLLAKEPAQTELTQACSRYPAAVQLTPEQMARVAGLFEELIAEAGTSTRLGSGTLAAAIIAHLLILFLREAALRREPVAETEVSTPDLDLARVLEPWECVPKQSAGSSNSPQERPSARSCSISGWGMRSNCSKVRR